MNINIYLEDSLAKSLNQYVKQTGVSRNAIVREALKEWIIHHHVKQWPRSILNFTGISEDVAFESFRQDLLPPNENHFT